MEPAAILSVLAGKGLTSIYCEGGGTLAASLVQAGLVEDLLIYTAGKFIGAEGQPAIGALGSVFHLQSCGAASYETGASFPRIKVGKKGDRATLGTSLQHGGTSLDHRPLRSMSE